LANRIRANREVLTQFKPCDYLAAAITDWNIPMVRLLSGLCVLRDNKRCRCWPNCFLDRRLPRGGRSLLDYARTRAAFSGTTAPAIVVMILCYRSGVPLMTEPMVRSSVAKANYDALSTARNAVARNSVFLLWALRLGCECRLDKNVIRIIVKQVFVGDLAELMSA
jgi:hypothetical protein